MARRRTQWTLRQGRIDPVRLVFIDETWTKTNMSPLRGWAPRGARLKAKAPHGHWNTTTFLAALRHDRIDAPWLFEGPINGESFLLYVEKVLLPHARPGRHRGDGQPRQSQNQGRPPRDPQGRRKLIFLPKYSPDLNPIEQVFAKLKHFLRKAAARTPEALCDAVAQILDTFSPEECANYLANSGYARA